MSTHWSIGLKSTGIVGIVLNGEYVSALQSRANKLNRDFRQLILPGLLGVREHSRSGSLAPRLDEGSIPTGFLWSCKKKISPCTITQWISISFYTVSYVKCFSLYQYLLVSITYMIHLAILNSYLFRKHIKLCQIKFWLQIKHWELQKMIALRNILIGKRAALLQAYPGIPQWGTNL